MILHQGIILEPLYGVYVYIHTAIGTDDLRTLLNVAYASLAQYVKFLITKLLSSVHIPLSGRKSLRRHVECRITA